MVHQELAFCRDLSVAENLSMGHYPRKLGVMVDKAEMERRATELLGKIGVSLDVRQADERALHRAGATRADLRRPWESIRGSWSLTSPQARWRSPTRKTSSSSSRA